MILLLALVSPLLVLLLALGRALVLFWPTMLLFGAVHSYVPAVPAFGWAATFFIVALISVLFPSSTASQTNSK